MRPTILIAAAICVLVGCGVPDDNGRVKRTDVAVPVGVDDLTTEQRNIMNRLMEDNKPGAIKHLYVISAYSGDVILYSTVAGKVTSGGKRLTPLNLTGAGQYGGSYYSVEIRGSRVQTAEIMQDDGTYGSSVEYLYWWDARGIYHQHYVSGGQIVHISSEPLAVKSVILNLELQN